MSQPTPSSQSAPSGLTLPLLCLAVLLGIAGPQFVRMPLTNDTVLYDLESRMLREGAMLYRDVLEPNLPGVVWVHVGVRRLLGESSAALRAFDLGVLAVIIMCAAGLFRAAHRRSSAAAWFALAATGFYLSMSEWCHTQRDTWMLAPALLALWMRCRHIQRRAASDHENSDGRGLILGTFAEGLMWGAAVWIKPHVVVPALGAWIVGCLFIRSWRGILSDAAALLAGGLLAGALGIGWLLHSGSWSFFWETLREWNPRYVQVGRENWTSSRFLAMTFRMWPWIALHLPAVPVAIWTCGRALWGSRDGIRPAQAMLAALYLGWLAQSLLVQHLFDYVHVPAILLAILFLMLYVTGGPRVQTGWRIGCALFALLAVTASPVFHSERLGVWKQCVTGPVTPRLQDRLAYFQNPQRADLERVAEYLRRQDASGHDVCCYSSDLIGLYSELDLDPPTRFVYLQELLIYFPDRREEMLQALCESGHRFVVTDLVGCGMTCEQAEQVGPTGPLGPPPGYPAVSGVYPWSCPVVYRSGTYLVHRVEDTAGDRIEPFLGTARADDEGRESLISAN